jgi:predicted nucleotidyltransferase
MAHDFDKITREAKEALGDNLVSLVLYGSHARKEATTGSDVNLFLVVRDQRPDALRGLLEIVPKWLKDGVTAPVIFRQDQLVRGLDSFAIEFAEMAAARKVLLGSDPFAAFKPDWETVRSELEREARQKQIAVTRRWLAAGGKPRAVPAILADMVPGCLALLRSTLMLKKQLQSPLTLDIVLEELRTLTWFNPDLWKKLRAVAKKHEEAFAGELTTLMEEFIGQLIALVSELDQMK